MTTAEFTPCSSGHVHQISFVAGPDMPEQIISAFERDALNREILRTQGQGYAKREYDPLSRITRIHSGSFDPESQIRSLGVSFDTSPLVRKQFSYDLNGELKRCSKSGVTWRYYYNSDNQLVEAHMLNG